MTAARITQPAEEQDSPPSPFELHAEHYNQWFTRHPHAYASELAAIRELWPATANSLEIGAGAGHFAAPLGITTGVEPAEAMRQLATAKGIQCVDAKAEHLPFATHTFHAVLMVTTICFVDDPAQSLAEASRVLRPGGTLIVAFVDRHTPLGQEYQRNRQQSLFYRAARFFGTDEITALLTQAGLIDLDYRQTLFTHPNQMTAPDPVRPGYGQGAFVAVRARKPEAAPC